MKKIRASVSALESLMGISPAVAAREYFMTAYKLRWAFLTVAAVLALAYVMNQSGQTLTIGNWIAATGAFLAHFLSELGIREARS